MFYPWNTSCICRGDPVPTSLSHPSLGWLYVFSLFPPHPRPPLQQLLPLTSKRLELNLIYLAQRIYGSGEIYWMDPSMTRSWLWHQLAKICLSARLSENHSSDHYKTWQLYCPSHGHYLIRFWRNSVVNFYFGKFSLKKFKNVFFQGQTLFWTYLRNGWSDWCETKRKCIGWILGTICDLDLWPHSWPWPWMFQGQISK